MKKELILVCALLAALSYPATATDVLADNVRVDSAGQNAGTGLQHWLNFGGTTSGVLLIRLFQQATKCCGQASARS